MDVQPGSKWYVVSFDWLNKWKSYVGFDGDTDMEREFPGPCDNKDIVEAEENRQICCDKDFQHMNMNLKDNL